MPGFIKTPHDEALWAKAKAAVAKYKKKPESEWKDQSWATVNSIFQKMKAKHPSPKKD